MKREMLESDCNFYYKGQFGGVPAEVMYFMRDNADYYNRYVSFIYQLEGDIAVRTWAFRDRNKFEYTEVERKTLDLAIRKNIYLTAMSGYHPVYQPKTHVGSSGWYGYSYTYFDGNDFDKWSCEPAMGLMTTIINIGRLFEIEKYRYCGFSGGCELFRYLEFFNKEPMVEYFGKIGIEPGAKYISLAKKDKQFIWFLKENVEEINKHFYNQTEVIWAYKNKCSFEEARRDALINREALRATAHFENIKRTGVDRVKLFNWIKDNHISFWSYADYFKAIYWLELDLNDTKNLYPKDFNRMHDLRINQYKAQQAKIDAKKRAELYERFRKRAENYKPLEVEGEKYSVIIPSCVPDLIREGKELHHCVGKMGYDSKMADGKCIIAFIRVNEQKEKPFVTVEYLTDKDKISQCYGDHDSRPDDEVKQFADEWAENVKKRLKKATA